MRQLFLFGFVLILLAFSFDTKDFLRQLSSDLQTWCSDRLASNASTAEEMNRALACGRDLPQNSEARDLLLRTGLYHLIVVSGSHLTLLAALLATLPWWCFTTASLGLLLMTGLQPPLARGLFQYAVNDSASGAPAVGLSYIACLLVWPEWANSLSLHLSTAASLALSLHCPRGLRHSLWGILWKFAAPWLLILPFLWNFNSLHLSQLACNILFAGVATLVLVPLAYLHLVFPQTQTDVIHESFLRVIRAFAFETDHSREIKSEAIENSTPLSLALLGVFIFVHIWNVLWLRTDRRMD